MCMFVLLESTDFFVDAFANTFACLPILERAGPKGKELLCSRMCECPPVPVCTALSSVHNVSQRAPEPICLQEQLRQLTASARKPRKPPAQPRNRYL